MKQLDKIWALLRSVFGEFRMDWNPPAWWISMSSRLSESRVGAAIRRGMDRAKAHPRRAMGWGAGVAVAIAAIVVGVQQYLEYLESRPKPAYVTVTIRPPRPTDPEKKIVDKLAIEFSTSAASLSDLDREINQGVSISPSVPGIWKWESDRRLVFVPGSAVSKDEARKFNWPAGQEYQVKFDNYFFPGHLEFEEWAHSFTTSPIELSFSNAELYIDPQNPKNKRVIATIKSNYPLEPEEFKKKVEFEFQSADESVLKKPARQVPFSVAFNPYFTEAYLQSEPIQLPKENHVMKVQVGQGVRASVGGEPSDDAREFSVDVAGLYEGFKVGDVQVIFARNEKFEPEQVLILETRIGVRSEDISQALEVFLLPADHQPAGSRKIISDYRWSSPGEFTDAIKGASIPVELKVIPSENTYTDRHSFKVKLPVNRFLFVRLKKGVKGIGDYELGANHEQIVAVPDFSPELQFMSDGSLLSLSGDKKLPLLARNIEEVTFEIARIIPAQVNHLISSIGQSGSFKRPYVYGDNMIAEKFKVDQKLAFKSRSETIYFSLDLEPYIKENRGFFLVKVSSKPSSDSKTYVPQKDDQRLILVTDLGIMAKQSISGATDIFVQNVRTGHPVSEAQVEVLGMNGISALSVSTDAQGRAQLPDLKDFENEKKPVAFLVRRGADSSYIPYQNSTQQLQYSRFEVDGVHESSESDQLTAMLFSDRGIYRPGDTVKLGVILRSKNWRPGLPEVPMIWTVTDSKGALIKKENFRASSFGLLELSFATQDISPTGNYEARVSIVKERGELEYTEQLGSLSIRIEEFVPDQMRISTVLDPFRTTGWVPLGKLKASVSLKNLFGTPAENRVIQSSIALVPTPPHVPGFKDFLFANPNTKDARITTEALDEKRSDDKGNASYDIDLAKYEGYFQLRFQTEGFQAEGGRSVNANASIAVSSLPFLVGYKPDGDLHFINRSAERAVQLIAVDAAHESIDATGLKLVLVEQKYVSSLIRQNDGTYKYQSVRKDFELKEQKLPVKKGGSTLKLSTESPGDFAYSIRNDAGRELNRIEFNVVGETNLSRSLDRTAELQLVLNKVDFQPGEEIEIQIKSPYSGAGLITIERDSVYAHKWFKASTTSLVERIRIPAGLEGNAYVNVAFLRAIDSREIFMSPLSYGVQPFSISLDRHRTKINLKAPQKVKPGERLSIEYSSDRPTQIVLYGVDEGILQVAGYKLPDPIRFFFRKKALQVRTYQLLDMLLPEYSLIQQMAAPGGDEGYGALGRNLNPFKRKDQPPIAFWSGILKADATPRTYTYTVPEYFNGNIKLMAISSSAEGLGSLETATLSRGDFVISPTTPLFVAPSDEFVIGVNVSNQSEEPNAPSQLVVKLAASEHLESVGPLTQTIDVTPGREKGLDFRLKAKSKPGSGDIRFEVSGGGKSARLTAGVSIRPALPYVTSLHMGLTDKLPLELPIDRMRIPEFRKTSLDASALPLSLSKGLQSFLDEYPYGCTEQLISRAIPALVFRTRPEFNFDPGKAKATHDHVIGMLRTRQTSNGGYGLYPGADLASVPASLYAIRYLTEAEARGLSIPEDLRARMLAYLKLSELRNTQSLASARLFAEAIYLQARNHQVPTNDLNFLREVLEKTYRDVWEKDATAAFLAGTYALLKQEGKGLQLLRRLELGQSGARDGAYYDGTVRDAIVLQIAGRFYPEQLKRLITRDGMENLVRPLQNGQYNTYSSAQMLMAMESMLAAAENAGFPDDMSVEEIVAGKPRAISFARSLIAHVEPSGEATSVRVAGSLKTPLFYALSQQGFDRELPTEEIKNGLEISRIFLSKSGSPVSKVKLGEEVTVSLRTRGLGDPFDHLVLVDLFPAGFELIPESRVTGTAWEAETGEGEQEFEEGEETEESVWILPFLRSAYAEQAVSLSPLQVFFADYREDRVVVYGRASRELAEFQYRLKAINRGKFVVPPAFGESMYDRSIHYRGMAQAFEIE
ncbi:MAG: hypothetical protein A2X94_04800 [Bdellovibrionales bacterium GWB1_55_8]|nr:MAG: hypothetical protein A2X94_04800 [Bdellovibrionales bacterium GWB1_55_8]